MTRFVLQILRLGGLNALLSLRLEVEPFVQCCRHMRALERAISSAITHIVHYAATIEYFQTFLRRAELFCALWSAFSAACDETPEPLTCGSCAWDSSEHTDVHASERNSFVKAIGVDGHACLAVTTAVSRLCDSSADIKDMVRALQCYDVFPVLF